MQSDHESTAISIDMTLRMWSDNVHMELLLDKINIVPQIIHVVGESMPKYKGKKQRIAKRNFASIKNVRGSDDADVSSWIVETLDLLNEQPELSALITAGQIEALLWIAIFGSRSEAVPRINSGLITACSQLGVKIMIENYTEFDDEGVPKKLWLN